MTRWFARWLGSVVQVWVAFFYRSTRMMATVGSWSRRKMLHIYAACPVFRIDFYPSFLFLLRGAMRPPL